MISAQQAQVIQLITGMERATPKATPEIRAGLSTGGAWFMFSSLSVALSYCFRRTQATV